MPRAGIVHRLDKDTSGILLVARTEKFRNYFVSLLQERKVKKKDFITDWFRFVELTNKYLKQKLN